MDRVFDPVNRLFQNIDLLLFLICAEMRRRKIDLRLFVMTHDAHDYCRMHVFICDAVDERHPKTVERLFLFLDADQIEVLPKTA